MSFDVLKFYFEAPRQSQEILDLFVEKHPQIKEYIRIHWAKTDKEYSNDFLFNYYCNLFFDFLIEYGKKTHQKIVLEGIQLFVRLHPSCSIGLPLIIIGSSSFQSFVNKIHRNYKEGHLPINILSLIKYLFQDTYIYHLKQRMLLNRYIVYLSHVHQFILKETNNEKLM